MYGIRREDRHVENEACPSHGTQIVTGSETLPPRHDPTEALWLSCGCLVAWYGPREPGTIVRQRAAK
jgi:hypothetical protein